MARPALDSCVGSIVVGLPGLLYAPLVPGFIEPHEHGEIALNWFVWDLHCAGSAEFFGRAPLSRQKRLAEKIANTSKPFYLARSINSGWMKFMPSRFCNRYWIAKSLFVSINRPSTARSTARELHDVESRVKNWIDKYIVDAPDMVGHVTSFSASASGLCRPVLFSSICDCFQSPPASYGLMARL